jgi:hypothetical protein
MGNSRSNLDRKLARRFALAFPSILAVCLLLLHSLGLEKDNLAVRDEKIEHMSKELGELQRYSAAHYVEGVVDPYSEKTKVILAATETDLPVNKQFRLSAPCIDPSKGRLELYILKEGRVFPYEIFPNEDITKVKRKNSLELNGDELKNRYRDSGANDPGMDCAGTRR